MMTSRSEYRLILRQDNADERLCAIGHRIGLVSGERLAAVERKYAAVRAELQRLESRHIAPSEAVNETLVSRGTAPLSSGASLAELIRRPQISYADTAAFDPERPELSRAIVGEVEISLKYDGYIRRQLKQVEEFSRMESRPLPPDIDYDEVRGLRIEAREKLKRIRPESFGRAGRISGVSPADLSVLMIYLEGRR